MKNSPTITALVLTASILGFVVLGLAGAFEFHYRQLRRLQPELVQSQNTRNLVNLIANDALEYSKTHPAIDSILSPVGVKSGKPPGTSPVNKPGSK